MGFTIDANAQTNALNTLGCIFFLLVVTFYLNYFGVVLSFQDERPCFLRE